MNDWCLFLNWPNLNCYILSEKVMQQLLCHACRYKWASLKGQYFSCLEGKLVGEVDALGKRKKSAKFPSFQVSKSLSKLHSTTIESRCKEKNQPSFQKLHSTEVECRCNTQFSSFVSTLSWLCWTTGIKSVEVLKISRDWNMSMSAQRKYESGKCYVTRKVKRQISILFKTIK